MLTSCLLALFAMPSRVLERRSGRPNPHKAKHRSLQHSWLSATCLRMASSLGSLHCCTNNDCEYDSPLPWRSHGSAYLHQKSPQMYELLLDRLCTRAADAVSSGAIPPLSGRDGCGSFSLNVAHIDFQDEPRHDPAVCVVLVVRRPVH